MADVLNPAIDSAASILKTALHAKESCDISNGDVMEILDPKEEPTDEPVVMELDDNNPADDSKDLQNGHEEDENPHKKDENPHKEQNGECSKTDKETEVINTETQSAHVSDKAEDNAKTTEADKEKVTENMDITLSDDEDNPKADKTANVYPEIAVQTEEIPGDAFEKTAVKMDTAANGSEKIVDLDSEDTRKESARKPPAAARREGLLPLTFSRSFRERLRRMTAADAEEFVLLKIVEALDAKSELADAKAKVKTLQDCAEEWRKKALLLSKQARDLQVVLKNVQEEHKRRKAEVVVPLRITRSVGLQVLMHGAGTRPRAAPNPVGRPRGPQPAPPPSPRAPRRPDAAARAPATPPRPPPPVVLRLGPQPPAPRAPTPPAARGRRGPGAPRGARAPRPAGPQADKRPLQATRLDSIDLTEDEPPAKARAGPGAFAPAAPRPPFSPADRTHTPPVGSVVYKSHQNLNNLSHPPALVRQRLASPMPKPGQQMSLNQIRMPIRANMMGMSPGIPPLPIAPKQLSNPAWRKLPPKPELKISKAENGIVISWITDVVLNETFEEIASYQIYAYQETSDPTKSTWKKIGDVKALPLPMACTLTQFSTGFKYFFAVRAVDVRSRVGPFSTPGSILLINGDRMLNRTIQ